MKFFEVIKERAETIGSWVCVGLDVNPEKIPAHIRFEENPILKFSQGIIEATREVALCYKINSAFFEAQGIWGIQALEKIFVEMPEDVPVILDAKRADIANTSEQYARSAFEVFGADAITVNPYLGKDSLDPFLEYEFRGVFILCATSNPGARDIQHLILDDGRPLYERVAQEAGQWNLNQNIGLVVGATQPEALQEIRQIAPDLPFLVPGVGAQGGALEAVVRWGVSSDGVPPIINSSRGIIYASEGENFAEAAREAALALRDRIREAQGL